MASAPLAPRVCESLAVASQTQNRTAGTPKVVGTDPTSQEREPLKPVSVTKPAINMTLGWPGFWIVYRQILFSDSRAFIGSARLLLMAG